MNAHVGLTIDSGQAKFSDLRHLFFPADRVENARLGRECSACVDLKRRLEFHPVGFGDGAMGQSAVHRVNAADKRRLAFAGFLQTEIRQELDVAISNVR